MFSRILVPYDISMPADKALKHAVALAEVIGKGKVEIILLHVVAELPLRPLIEIKESRRVPQTAAVIEHIEKVHDESRRYISQMIDTKCKKYRTRGIDVKAVILRGTPVEKILEFAAEKKFNLIIVGSVGWGEMTKSQTLGSVARGIVERARCPVTVVRS
jgi:nucleotide-binding universal stress UspA family protein